VAASARGGAWLLAGPAATFTRESLSDDHRLIIQTTTQFAEHEVMPALEALERKDWAVARSLVERCGALGLLAVDAPEEHGGLALDTVSSIIVAEHIARSASFATTFGAQATLSVLPIAMFGTDDQKARYLPRLVAGTLVGAYGMTEAGSGSDALSARTVATRQADGSYRLTGEKMWITNGGFADVVIVFAKVDGEHFSAFIVERGFGGLTSGHEEHKMGLHGSSTTALALQDVPVPAANVLGEIGRGHKVAFNVLNLARLKLGAMCVGGCRVGFAEAARYAATRRQFGHPIASFGAIRHKLGEMTARTYALEALVYRVAGLIDDAHAQPGAATLPAVLEEFAVESSIAKVAGSETLDYVLDENVQIHGGNGYVRDYPAERHYRDARVNRIFEGTNEINRLLIPGLLVKRAVKGDLPLIPAARQLLDDLMSPGLTSAPEGGTAGPLHAETQAVAAFKKVVLIGLGATLQRFGQSLPDEQESLLWLADLVIDTFAAESAVLRASAAVNSRAADAGLHEAAAKVFVSDAALRIEMTARQLLATLADGDTLRTHLAALRRVLKVTPAATVPLRRTLADESVVRGRYLF
jgi:alkylation response protein AidB-like acyl-CoA dehydrogenase